MRALPILVVLSFASPLLLRAQSVPATAESPAPVRTYHLLREDDDWSFLADPAQRQEFWDPIKYVQLRPGRDDWLLSIGGEAREVWDQHVRTFVELKSGINSFRIGGPRPIWPGAEVRQANRHLWLQADYGIFYAGRFLKETEPGRNLNYWALWAGYKF